jgi:uncharacterized protein YjbI with pentapeptide repeats
MTVLSRMLSGRGGLDLHSTDLRKAWLDGAHLEAAFLSSAHLEGANLAHARLDKAILHGAHLEKAVLLRTNLQLAILDGAQLSGALANEGTVWPSGFDWQAASVVNLPSATAG